MVRQGGVQCRVMAQDHNFIGVVDVCFVKGLLLQWTPVDKEYELESRNLVPNF